MEVQVTPLGAPLDDLRLAHASIPKTDRYHQLLLGQEVTRTLLPTRLPPVV